MQTPFRQNLTVALAIAAPLLWCWGSALVSAQALAYRDAAHFYYPLETWIRASWERGQWPLWNDQDGIGMPVVADVTSAVFYPGKLIFTLPWAGPQGLVAYTLLHLAVAAAGAFSLARHGHFPPRNHPRTEGVPPGTAPAASAMESSSRQLSPAAAGLCAVAYSLSGAVLFQYCNPIFLVGAAWLPWTLLATHFLLTRRSLFWAVTLGISLALMILGGDPQAAYHAGVVAALYTVLLARTAAQHAADCDANRRARSRLVRTASLLAVAGLTASLLAAVQIVPAWSWMRTSNRAMFTVPRSLYEVPAYLRRDHSDQHAAGDTAGTASDAQPWRGVVRGLLGTVPATEHGSQIYGFSVAPWRLAEVFWPNVSGRPFPTNQRWLAAIGGEDRVWTPSLYLGVLPVLLALATWRLRTADTRVQWFSWIVLLAVVGSFGRYGAGFLFNTVHSLLTGDSSGLGLSDAVGGLYWWLVAVLPGYAQFRFPAKLWVLASLGIALLAGIGLDRVLHGSRDGLIRQLRRLGLVSLGIGVVVAATRPGWDRWFAGTAPDELYGPLDAGAAWLDVLTACGHTALVCGVAWWMVAQLRPPVARLGLWLLLLTAGELARAQGWMLLTVPATAFHTPCVVGRSPHPNSPVTVYRWPTRGWVPATWRTSSSPSRAEEVVAWDAATLYAKLHLLGPHRSILPQASIPSRDYQAMLATGDSAVPHPALLDLLGVEYLVLPAASSSSIATWQPLAVTPPLPEVALWRNPQAFPRAWIVHEVEVWPRWESSDPGAVRRYFDELCFPAGRVRDFRRTAIVESDAVEDVPACQLPGAADRSESVRVVARQPQSLELEADLTAPGLIVLNQFFDRQWQINVTAPTGIRRSAAIVRVNRIMQGVFLPAGAHRLTFRYVPHDLYWAGGVSVASWLCLLTAAGVYGLRNRRTAVQI